MAESDRQAAEKNEHYNHTLYQKTSAIESRALFGVNIDEKYRREVGIVMDETPQLKDTDEKLEIKKVEPEKIMRDGKRLDDQVKNAGIKWVDRFNLNLGPGKKVLDIAAGEGDTSRLLASTGAQVDSRDLAVNAVDRGQERDDAMRASADVKKNIGEVIYAPGNMAKVTESLADESPEQYDAVVCMGRSFIYLDKQRDYENALKEWNDLIVPGGKVVLQWRERTAVPQTGKENLGVRLTVENGDTIMEATEDFEDQGIKVQKGEKYIVPKGEYREMPNGVTEGYGDKIMVTPDGNRTSLGHFKAQDYMKVKHLPLLKKMLEKAGFQNVSFKAEYLSPAGDELVCAICAEKPGGNVIPSAKSHVRHGVRKLLR